MKAIDLNLSVLWADEDYKAENGRRFYTFVDAIKLKFKNGWRIPTADEYLEMMHALRKTEIKFDGKLAYRYRKNKNENEIIFPADGFQDTKGIKMICEGFSALRHTSDWWGQYHCITADLQDKNVGFDSPDAGRLSIRLVKDNSNFKGEKLHYIFF